MFKELHPILIKFVESAFSELYANAALYIDLDTTKYEAYKFMYQKYKINYDSTKYYIQPSKHTLQRLSNLCYHPLSCTSATVKVHTMY